MGSYHPTVSTTTYYNSVLYRIHSQYYNMRVLVVGCLVCSVAMVLPASVDMEEYEVDFSDYEDSMEIEEDYNDEKLLNPRSRVLFEEDEVLEEKDSSAINLNARDEKVDLNQKISFIIPEDRSSKIEMTLKEINEIFNKKKFMKNKGRQLHRRDRKAARECRKKKLLFSTKDKKCHQPTSPGRCKNNKWFVAVKGQLQGVCKVNKCQDNEKPILFNGTCSPLHGSCPPGSRLFLNKRGEGYCDCDEGYSYNREDDSCYKEHTAGPCTSGEMWLQRNTPQKHRTGHKVWGKCKENKCEEGEVEWKDKKCYKVDEGEMFDMCVSDEKGEIVLEDNIITCKMVMEGRAVIGGVSRSCRRGRAWSRYRNRCVRVFSRG